MADGATPRKSHAERIEEIARTALIIAADVGAAGVTTQAIADRMGVSQATVFRHFDTRDAIFRAAFDIVRRDVFDALGPVFDDATLSGRARLDKLLVAHLAFIQDNPGVPALLFSDGLHAGDPALKTDVRRLMKSFAGRVAGLVMAGVEDGSVPRTVDAALVGQAFVTFVQGAALRWMLFDRAFDLTEQAPALWAVLGPALTPSTTS